MSVKIQDWNKIASQVVLVALGPDGKPALLSADKPAGTLAEKFTYSSGKVITIEYFSTYDTVTQTGTLLATKNIRYNGDEVNDIYWTF
jgi:hypothetical protein